MSCPYLGRLAFNQHSFRCFCVCHKFPSTQTPPAEIVVDIRKGLLQGNHFPQIEFSHKHQSVVKTMATCCPCESLHWPDFISQYGFQLVH